MKRTGVQLENIFPDDRIIWLAPGETILAHTNEFIGTISLLFNILSLSEETCRRPEDCDGNDEGKEFLGTQLHRSLQGAQ
jgi:hypothetical protein